MTSQGMHSDEIRTQLQAPLLSDIATQPPIQHRVVSIHEDDMSIHEDYMSINHEDHMSLHDDDLHHPHSPPRPTSASSAMSVSPAYSPMPVCIADVCGVALLSPSLLGEVKPTFARLLSASRYALVLGLVGVYWWRI